MIPRPRLAYRWANSQLRLAGVDSAAREAYYLFCEDDAQPRPVLAEDQQQMDPGDWLRYVGWVIRRCDGEPLQYIKRRANFYSLSFCVNPAVMIPRPETEILVEAVLQHPRLPPGPILDVGTGCGAVAVVLARHMHQRKVVAVDISPDALRVARHNAWRLGVADRIEFLCGDLFSPVSGRRFAAVVSNPPYVASEEMARLPRQVREFEPPVALDGGSGGMQVIERLIASAGEHLVGGALLALEIGYGQARAVQRVCREHLGSDIGLEVRQDLSGIERVITCELAYG